MNLTTNRLTLNNTNAYGIDTEYLTSSKYILPSSYAVKNYVYGEISKMKTEKWNINENVPVISDLDEIKTSSKCLIPYTNGFSIAKITAENFKQFYMDCGYRKHINKEIDNTTFVEQIEYNPETKIITTINTSTEQRPVLNYGQNDKIIMTKQNTARTTILTSSLNNTYIKEFKTGDEQKTITETVVDINIQYDTNTHVSIQTIKNTVITPNGSTTSTSISTNTTVILTDLNGSDVMPFYGEGILLSQSLGRILTYNLTQITNGSTTYLFQS